MRWLGRGVETYDLRLSWTTRSRNSTSTESALSSEVNYCQPRAIVITSYKPLCWRLTLRASDTTLRLLRTNPYVEPRTSGQTTRPECAGARVAFYVRFRQLS